MTNLLGWFYYAVYNQYDPRTNDWFLVSGPGPLITILLSYLYFSTYAGPKYMKDKPPYSLRTPMTIYNIIQILISIYLVHEGLMAGWLYEYSWTCQPVDYSNSPAAMRVANGVHLYYMCKLMELFDTVFFILRKKQRQITLLHIYHHATMPLAAWVGVRFFAGGHPTFLGVLNCFVHIFMYTYYLLTAAFPGIQRKLWWKKYITELQLVQFVIVGLHSGQMLFTDCNFPKAISAFTVLDSAVFYYLFRAFYIQNYCRNIPAKDEQWDLANSNASVKSQ